MAKPKNRVSKALPILPGVTNYDKLRNIKGFNQFNPFLANTFSKKAKDNAEASSLDDRYLDEEIYRQLLVQNGYGTTRTSSRTSYYSMDKKVRREQLIRLSVHDIVDEVLTKLTDEIVVNVNGESPIKLNIDNAVFEREKINDNYRDEVVDYAKKSFKNIIKIYGLEQNGSNTSLWNKVYLFLTEGTQAYEIVWNDINNPKYITGIHEIDALDTTPFWWEGIQYWKHHKTRSRREEDVVLFDTQIVYIDYASASPNNRMSYLEHLMKAFNDLRIIDETTINWSIVNSTFRTIMKIPTKGLSRTQAAASVNREMSRWNDEMIYDRDTGEFSINGQNRLQMMKSIYMAEGPQGSPEISNFTGDGPDFNSMDRNNFFERRFYRAARIPLSRFDLDGGASWNLDTRSMLREEITYNRFVNRLRDIIKILILKPLKLELVARFPELKKDDILDAFDVRFVSYNVFEELMEMDILNEKVDGITKLADSFVQELPDGTQMKMFSHKFLMEKFLKELTEEDLERNEEMLLKETEKLFKYQIKLYQLKSQYDPELNIDPMSGTPDNNKIDNRAEDTMGPLLDFEAMDDDTIDGEIKNKEETSGSDAISSGEDNELEGKETEKEENPTNNKDSKKDRHKEIDTEIEKEAESQKG